MNLPYVLASNLSDAQSTVTSNSIWNSLAVPVAAVLGAILVVFGMIKVATQVAGGKPQGAFKTAALVILGAAVLFRLELIFVFLNAAGSIVETVAKAVQDLIG